MLPRPDAPDPARASRQSSRIGGGGGVGDPAGRGGALGRLARGVPASATPTVWGQTATAAGTPAAVIAKLNAATQDALKDLAVREPMARQGLEPTGGSPADAAAHIKRELATWGRVIKEAGIKAQ